MDFVSKKFEALKSAAASISNEDAAVRNYFDILTDIVGTICAELDILKLKAEEYDECSETLSSQVQQIGAGLSEVHSLIVGDVGVDTDNYTEQYDADNGGHVCSCGHCHDDDEDEDDENVLTLLCPFCEELFLVDGANIGESTECPNCGKIITVADAEIN